MPAVGQRFREAREARGLTLPEVAEQIRIRAVYLDAIEKEDWSAIGAPVYIRGFLRTYARFLGLDAEEIVAEFNLGEGERGAIVPSRGDIADVERAGGSRRLQLSPLIWIASLVAIVLIAFVVYNELTLPKPGQTVAFLATPTPTAAATAAATVSATPSTTPSPASSVSPSASPSPLPTDLAHALILRLTGVCWLRVTVDGNKAFEGMFPMGTTKVLTGKRVDVLAGNAGAAEIVLDGKDLGKMGASGEVVERSFSL